MNTFISAEGIDKNYSCQQHTQIGFCFDLKRPGRNDLSQNSGFSLSTERMLHLL